MRAEHDRRTVLADAAIELLASGGMRALTHRGVDARAELPVGTTSAYFRTRKALITKAVQRLVELDAEDLRQVALAADGPLLAPPRAGLLGPAHLDQLADATAAFVDHMLGPGRVRTLARYHCILETVHEPELREILRHGDAARAQMCALLTAAGIPRPRAEERARRHLACVDGLIFDRLTAPPGTVPTPGTPESRDDLREAVRGLLEIAVSGERALPRGSSARPAPPTV
ncbi:TetR/AcrR family transcriptional regulator [Embleya sp. MST-111070]|uniref:TetR/AcrR family transcriptional regulator n=1 Tax=Embleya sp. MST-111070 TaxID=3398231 RepID=UPI003F741C2C